jgi:hypothetical protein
VLLVDGRGGAVRRNLRCGIALLLFAALGVVQAQESPPSQLRSDDVQAVFETLLYRGCQRQVGPLLQGFEREIPSLRSDQDTQNRICACTVKVASDGPRMKMVFELSPDKLKVIANDPEVMEYLKAKTATSLLQCTGFAYDQILDPRVRQR